jgi:DNA-binding MarR family transcriptional regulator
MDSMAKRSRTATDYRSLSDFRYEIRRFLNFSEKAARDAGLEPQQHQALLTIKGLPTHRIATIGVLSERLQIQHHSAVELADRLEAKRLIRRSRTQQDRRAVVLSLTARGERFLRDVTLPHLAELRTAGRKLLQTLGLVMNHENYNDASTAESAGESGPAKRAAKSAQHPVSERKRERSPR